MPTLRHDKRIQAVLPLYFRIISYKRVIVKRNKNICLYNIHVKSFILVSKIPYGVFGTSFFILRRHYARGKGNDRKRKER